MREGGISFVGAMAAYAVLALLATFTLDGPMRGAVLLLLLALAVRTWVADRRKRY